MQFARSAAAQAAADRPATAAARAPVFGNQARLRRLAPTIQRKIVASNDAEAVQTANMINDFCPGSAMGSGTAVVPVGGTCPPKGESGPGCDCACKAMGETRRTYHMNLLKMDPLPVWRDVAGGGRKLVPELAEGPNTSGPACGPDPIVTIPRFDSTVVFGSFDTKGDPVIASTPRILAHELCGHGVKCQDYKGDSGDRQMHDSTIATENAIYSKQPQRGLYGSRRQGESFFRAAGTTELLFRLKDGLHYENVP